MSKLNEFLHYLQNEKGYSQGTIEVYELDVGRELFPFLQQRGKFAVEEVTKDDIRAYLAHGEGINMMPPRVGKPVPLLGAN